MNYKLFCQGYSGSLTVWKYLPSLRVLPDNSHRNGSCRYFSFLLLEYNTPKTMLTFHYFFSGGRTHYTHVTFRQHTDRGYVQSRASRFGGRTLRDQVDNDVTSGSIRMKLLGGIVV